MSQTSNPKRPGLVWNKPKASTYSRFAGAMFLDSDGHVQHTGCHEYMSSEDVKKWADTFRAGVPAASLDLLDRWVAAKVAYSANRKPEDDLTVGLVEARRAFVTKGED